MRRCQRSSTPRTRRGRGGAPELGTNIALRLRTAGGDLDAAFARPRVVRQRYRVPRLAPAPLETRGVVAHYQPQDDMLTVWDSTQHPHEVRDQIATLLHRPEHRVRVVARTSVAVLAKRAVCTPKKLSSPTWLCAWAVR